MKKRPILKAEVEGAISVARNANFNRLWGSQILSQVAINLLNFALIIRVYQLAQGTRFANISVALLILSFGLPSVLFAAAAGVFVDHWNKRLVLMIVNFLRALLVLGYIVFEQNLWVVLALSFGISVATQFFVPAEAAAIPRFVTARQLLRANALFVFTMYASFIVGYSASAPTIALLGSYGPYLVTAAMFAIAGLLDYFLPNMVSKQVSRISASKLVRYTWREVNTNWRLIRTNHNLAFPIVQLTIGQALLAVVMALAPALAIALVGVPIEKSSHYLIIPAGVGLVVGVAIVERLASRVGKTRLIAAGVVLAGACLVALSLTQRLRISVAGHPLLTSDQSGAVVAVIVFVLGMVNAMVSVAAQTILQENTTDSSRGKVFGALSMLINVAATAPVLFVGVLADLTSVTAVILMVGATLLAFGIFQVGYLGRTGRLARTRRPLNPEGA